MNQPLDRKIVSAEVLAATLARSRRQGRTVVQCHGCFDIVHPGHVRYLRSARELGDILVVSLTADAGINKGADRPYIPQELRAENLAALEFVDWVVVDSNGTACELLEQLKPNVYVKGHEYAHSTDPRFQRERDIVERHDGRVVFHSGDVVFSSTRLIESLDRDALLDEVRLRTTCLRGAITATSLRETLDAFQQLRVLVVGDLVRERYVLCDASSTASRAPIMSLQQLGTREYWGGAAAVAQQVRALGAQPVLITSMGNEPHAERDRAQFAQQGIETTWLHNRAASVERTTFVADDDKLFEMVSGQAAPVDTQVEREALAALNAHINAVDAVLWCDLGYGMVTGALVDAVRRHKHRAQKVVAGYAASPRSDMPNLFGCDLITTTERRLREAAHDMSSGLSSAAYRLLSSLRSETALVSIHKRGLIGFDGRRREGDDDDGQGNLARLRSDFVPSFTHHYIDLLGADEAIFAAGTLSFTATKSVPQAAYLAAAAEAVTVARPGGRALIPEELHALLAGRPELWPESRFVADRGLTNADDTVNEALDSDPVPLSEPPA